MRVRVSMGDEGSTGIMDRSEVFEWCILHFGVLTLVYVYVVARVNMGYGQ